MEVQHNMDIKWLLQKNLTSPNTLEQLKSAVSASGASYEEITVIPFSDVCDYPVDENFIHVVYGTTTLMINAYHSVHLKHSVFFDEENFQMNTYLKHWKEKMLNDDGVCLSVEQIMDDNGLNDEALYFIRPCEDTKLFNGGVMSLSEFKNDLLEITEFHPSMNKDTMIFLARPKKIHKEWRNFIVNKKVVSSSRYCLDGELNIDNQDIPTEMISFVTMRCQTFTPHAIFVMDVALSDGIYSIIECNCFNGTGFYDHDVAAIVKNNNEEINR
jgi:hypothetical protein